MNGSDILDQIKKAKADRLSVYLNEKRVRELYDQRIGAINQIITSGELGAAFEAGLPSLIGVNIGGKQSISSEREISTVLKALIVESVERQRKKLHQVDEDLLPRGALVWFMGESHVVTPQDEASEATTGFPVEVAQFVQKQRASQGKGLQKDTILWSARSNKYLASIASVEWVVDLGHIYSYPAGGYGILGRVESESQNILFIAPIWIWYESEETRP